MAKSRRPRAAASPPETTGTNQDTAKKPAREPRKKPDAKRSSSPSRGSPLDRAQKLVDKALEQDDPDWQIRQAQKAVEICPDCADAYTILAEYAADPAQGLMLCAAAVEAALRVIGSDALDSLAGKFWGMREARPYLRARLTLAQQLWRAGRRDSSIEHLRELLRLNPDDHQGVRYILASRLLEAGRDKEIWMLLKTFYEPSTFWSFSETLATFRHEGDTPDARRLLDEACERNLHVVPCLLETEIKPQSEPDPFYGPGDIGEAEFYCEEFAGGWRQTPGAITWLRSVVAESKLRKKFTRVGPTAQVKKRLLNLPQRFGAEWQSSIRRLPAWFHEGNGLHRPWSILAIDASGHPILGQELVIEQPTAAAVFDLLAKAMEKPLVGEPGRPSEIQVLEGPIWEEIRPHLEEIGVDCIDRTELNEIAFVEDQMREMFLAEQGVHGFVDTPGVELAQVESLFAAAAEYYRRAPWRRLPTETVIEVDSNRFRKHRDRPSYAVVMGQNNLSFGLAVFDEPRAIDQLNLDNPDAADDPDELNEALSEQSDDVFSLLFSEAFEISMADLLACEANHWPLGGPEAFPMVVRAARHPGRQQLEPWEFQLLEGCLRAIPRFVEQHELLIEPVSETITVSTYQGELELKLSWAPEHELCGEDCDDCHDHCEHDH
jgi:tetratricopeptide (TPR) repeat protein